MKLSNTMYLIIVTGLVFMGGCETGTKKSSSNTANLNQQTKELGGYELVDYMFTNKDAILNAEDCLKFSSQDWSEIYGDAIYYIAPADPMARSIDACRGVMGGVEAGYSLEQMSREDIKQGWLNGTVTSTTSVNSTSTQTTAGGLTLQKCENMYGTLNQAQWATQMTSGVNNAEVSACYQALVAAPMVGTDPQDYIDAYNQGVYSVVPNTNYTGIPTSTAPNSTNTYNPQQTYTYADFANIVESLSVSDCQQIFPGYRLSDLMEVAMKPMEGNNQKNYEISYKAAQATRCVNLNYTY